MNSMYSPRATLEDLSDNDVDVDALEASLVLDDAIEEGWVCTAPFVHLEEVAISLGLLYGCLRWAVLADISICGWRSFGAPTYLASGFVLHI